jgi:hypothetical protein
MLPPGDIMICMTADEMLHQLPVRFPLPLFDKLRQRAHDQRESMNSIVVRALEKELSDEN